MNLIELIHAFGLGLSESKNPEEVQYLNELIAKWTMLQI